MQKRISGTMLVIAASAVIAVFLFMVKSSVGQNPAPRGGQTPAPAPARGQAPAPAPARGQAATSTRVPRMPDGKPNFTGLWQSITTADWDIEDHPAEPGPYYQLGAIGAIPGGQGIVEGGAIPYKPEALAKKKQNLLDRWTLDPTIKCFMPGVPRATYMPFPFQIVQGQENVAIAYEFATSNRVIYTKRKREASVDTWMGTSNGRWEGDTLVVDVTGLNDQTWFDRAGNFHSDQLHVTERYTYRDPNVINYEATIEDPMVFTRPWKISLPLYRRLDRNAQIGEFKCVEFTEELVYGHLRRQPPK